MSDWLVRTIQTHTTAMVGAAGAAGAAVAAELLATHRRHRCRAGAGGVTDYTVAAPVEDWRHRAAAPVEDREPADIGGRFWFFATQNWMICRNVTFKQSIGTTPFEKMYGMKNDVSKFLPFWCRAYMHLNKDRRGGQARFFHLFQLFFSSFLV